MQTTEIETYDYTDETGQLLYQNCRYNPKTFKQRRPDGAGDYIWDLNGTRRVLYRLPELLRADSNKWVFYCEGEKDTDNVRWLMNLEHKAKNNRKLQKELESIC